MFRALKPSAACIALLQCRNVGRWTLVLGQSVALRWLSVSLSAVPVLQRGLGHFPVHHNRAHGSPTWTSTVPQWIFLFNFSWLILSYCSFQQVYYLYFEKWFGFINIYIYINHKNTAWAPCFLMVVCGLACFPHKRQSTQKKLSLEWLGTDKLWGEEYFDF